ncbi:MAG: efflux RND transporter permease subunit [Holosporales bacterium]|jgi:multidrug efflux pump|nr:efflux RND transporter permease subunit [Holosporales bacterium]
MNISEICIKRPVFAWVMTLVIILLGLVTGDRLQIRQYPKISSNFVTIKMDYHGVGPEIIENQITRNIEEAVSGIDGIETIKSTSDNGTGKVVLEMAEGRDIDSATNDIRDRLGKSEDKFPDDAQKPVLTKAGSGERSIITMVLTSSKMDPRELHNYASNELSHALEAVPGVARVDVYGSGKYKMSLALNPRKLAFYSLTVLDVVNAVRRQNIERPAGKIVSRDREYVITTVADAQTPEEFENIPIVTKHKNIIKLRDVGKAKLDTDDTKVASRYNGEKVVSMSVIAQSSSNPIQVARGIKAKHAELNKQVPEGVKLSVAYDHTTFIEKSLHEVYKTIIEAILLVVLVVFVFLRSMRAAFVPLITVPISLIGALFLMYMFNFTINNMTLMSMVLAIGLVVDDAIVVLENIYKYIEKGFNPIKAAIEGTKEVNFAVIAMTLTLCAVYTPVALARGITGQYFKEFSVTLAGAVLLSGFVALTLSPMMCSRTLAARDGNKKKSPGTSEYSVMWQTLKSKLDTSRILKKTDEGYAKLLERVLDNRLKSVFVAAFFVTFGLTTYLFLPSEQFPYEDVGRIGYRGHAPQTSTIGYTQRYVDALDRALSGIPEVESRHYVVTNPSFDGVALLKDDRKRSTDEVMAEVKEKYNAVAGIDARFDSGHDDSDDSSRVVTFVLRGNKSHKELRAILQNLINDLRDTGIVQSMWSTSNAEVEDYTVEILRDKASSLDIDPDTIANTIDSLIRGRVASHFKKDSRIYDVMVEIEEGFKKSPDQIGDIYVKTYANQREAILVPLTEVISVYAKSGPVSIFRYNRMRAQSVMGILKPTCSLGEAVKVISDIGKRNLPDDMFVDFTDGTKKFLTESNVMLLIFILALSFIYLVMAAQFESWRDPFIIILSVPLALVGGVLSLACLKSGSVNMFSNIGFLTLIGLITKHGILIVDFANKLTDKGRSIREAIQEASQRRLRPIMMTTFAMVLGSLPLALATGAGAETRIPLGIVIVGGMTLGTIFTIFLVPVFYTYITSAKRNKKYIAERQKTTPIEETVVQLQEPV